jgi:8-oxo-dGTP pyrophosphatase MutT (NUDIX family)
MAKYYTVYFDFRKIVLLTDFRSHFVNHNGLFVKCSRTGDLAKILVFFQTSRLTELYIITDDLEETFGEFTKVFVVIEAAGGVVRNSEGLILMIRRNGVWDLPKGKVDPGEQLPQAALREVEEECGIAPLQLGSLVTVTYHTYNMRGKAILKPTYWYNMQYLGAKMPVPQQEEGITDVVWVKPSNLNHYTCNSYGSIQVVLDKVL